MAGASRREIDELVELAQRFGAKGLAHVAVEDTGAVKSPIGKFLGDDRTERLAAAAGASPGDLVLIVADAPDTANDVLGRLRSELGARLGLADENVLAYLWVYRFPMYKWDSPRTSAGTRPTTRSPASCPEDEALLVTADGDPTRPSPKDPAGRARAMQYDVVLNGWELGGGSVRIWRRDLLERSFALQGHSLEADAREVRGDARGVRVRRAAPRRHRARHRPLGGPVLQPDRTSARSWRSRRRSPGRTSCSKRRRRPSRSSSPSSASASSARSRDGTS